MASGGYDYEFVPELPNEFICVICHLALRRPKQIEECGHRFCEPCFDDMRNHPNARDDLRCPIDRESFTEDQAFKDRGTERSIINWKIKCPKHANGCEWTGEINTLKSHEKDCQYQEERKCCRQYRAEIEELEHKLFKVKGKMNKELVEVREKMEILSKQVKKIEIVQKSPKGHRNSLFTHPESLSVVSAMFEWKCPSFSLNAVTPARFSPVIYYKQYCFQMALCPNRSRTILGFVLYRYRGKFDDPDEEINDWLPIDCQLVVNLKGKSKAAHKDITVPIMRPWIIEAGCLRSKEITVRKLIEKSVYSEYVVDGFYHIEFKFEGF